MATPHTTCPVAAVPLNPDQDRWNPYDWVQWTESLGLPVPRRRLTHIPAWLRDHATRIIERRAAIRAAEFPA